MGRRCRRKAIDGYISFPQDQKFSDRTVFLVPTLHLSPVESWGSEEVVLDGIEPAPPVGGRGRPGGRGDQLVRIISWNREQRIC